MSVILVKKCTHWALCHSKAVFYFKTLKNENIVQWEYMKQDGEDSNEE